MFKMVASSVAVAVLLSSTFADARSLLAADADAPTCAATFMECGGMNKVSRDCCSTFEVCTVVDETHSQCEPNLEVDEMGSARRLDQYQNWWAAAEMPGQPSPPPAHKPSPPPAPQQKPYTFRYYKPYSYKSKHLTKYKKDKPAKVWKAYKPKKYVKPKLYSWSHYFPRTHHWKTYFHKNKWHGIFQG